MVYPEDATLLAGRNGSRIVAQMICVPVEQTRLSHGFGPRHNPLDNSFSIFVFQLIICCAVSHAFYFLLRPLKQPKFVCRMLAGIVLGNSVLGRCIPYMDKIYPQKEKILLNTACSTGYLYYIFLYAVKTDMSVLLKTTKSGWIFGILSLIIPYMLIAGVQGLLLISLPAADIDMGTSNTPTVTIFVLSVTYLSDLISSLEQLNLLNSELANVAMTCAMFNDTIGWIYALSAIINSNQRAFQKLAVFVSFWVVLGFLFCIVRPAIFRVIKTTEEGKQVKETHMVFLLLAPLLIGFISDFVGLNVLIATLIFGLIIPDGWPLGAALIEKSEIFVNELFLPFVFLRIGLLSDVAAIFSKKAIMYSLIVFAAYFGKFLVACFASFYFKLRTKDILMLGLMLNLKGLMPFFFVNRQAMVKNIDASFFTTIVLGHALMTAIAVPLLDKFYKTHGRLGFSRSSEGCLRSLLTTSSIGELRVLLCIHNEEDVHGIINLLKAINPTEISPIYAYVIYTVDLIGRGTPLLSPYRSHKMIKKTSKDRIISAFANFSRHSKRFTMQPFTLIAPYKTMHESICMMAQDKSVPLIIVPFPKSQGDDITAKIKNFNAGLQAYAPCTVGVLVQGTSFSHGYGRTGLSPSYFNIAVIFLGGTDDREALALVDRMSTHPRVSITVIRINITQTNEQVSESEIQLDNKVFDQFKERHGNNACIACNQLTAEDVVQVIHTIQSLEQIYDLIIVGRRQRRDAEFGNHLANWTDYEELGLIGDLIASPDFCEGEVSVLVLQHHNVSKEPIHSRSMVC